MKEENKNKLTIPSSKGVLDCLNTIRNKYSSEDSEFNLVDTNDNINTLFISGLFSYLHQEYNLYDRHDFIIRTESLREFMGYSKGGKSKNIKEELIKLNTVTCRIRDETLALAEIEIQGRWTNIKSIYLHELAKAMRVNSRKQGDKYGSSYMSLVYADIVSTKNNSASEITIELCKLIERRGKITTNLAHISIGELIQRCQSLRYKINNVSTNSRKNQVLKEDIERASILMKKHTTIYEEYKDLEITYPNRLSLVESRALITASHEGKIIKEEKGIDRDENK